MIRKLLMIAVLAIASVGAYAATTNIDTSNLSAAQIAELKAAAANLAAKNAAPTTLSSMSVELAATWGNQAAQAAEGFAKALGIAARELGVTVNEFLKTDAGKLTAVLIVWKVAGASILSTIWAIVILITGLCLARVVYLRLFTKSIELVPYTRLWGMWTGSKKVRIPKSFSDLKGEGEWMVFFIMVAIVILTMLVSGSTLL